MAWPALALGQHAGGRGTRPKAAALQAMLLRLATGTLLAYRLARALSQTSQLCLPLRQGPQAGAKLVRAEKRAKLSTHP